eukprot:4035484-Pyramimonas_sp.AAC.1
MRTRRRRAGRARHEELSGRVSWASQGPERPLRRHGLSCDTLLLLVLLLLLHIPPPPYPFPRSSQPPGPSTAQGAAGWRSASRGEARFAPPPPPPPVSYTHLRAHETGAYL